MLPAVLSATVLSAAGDAAAAAAAQVRAGENATGAVASAGEPAAVASAAESCAGSVFCSVDDVAALGPDVDEAALRSVRVSCRIEPNASAPDEAEP